MSDLFLAVLFTILAQTITWFQVNSQFIWQFWIDKPILSAVALGLPSSLTFWYAAHYSYAYFGNLWSTRFVVFGLSYITFPIMTYLIANESMFEPKTLVCIALSIMIMLIQLYWR